MKEKIELIELSEDIEIINLETKLDFLAFFSDKEAIFQTMIRLGRIIIKEKTPVSTAYVSFNKEGSFIDFHFNKTFWESLTFYEKAFVIAHECLHVLLRHGYRLKNCENRNVANIAADLVVNHLLVEKFSFSRHDISFQKELCWRDTIFPKFGVNIMEDVAANTFEQYYQVLCNSQKQPSSDKMMKSLDGHDFLGDCDNESLVEKITETTEKESMEDAASKLNNHLGDPNTVGPNPLSKILLNYKHLKAPENTTWKKIFNKLIKDSYKFQDKEHLQWIRKSRRNNLLPSNLFLPHSIDSEEMKKDKLKIELYIDVSGSCYSMRQPFWLAYESIPKKLFDVSVHTYSDYVYPVDLKTKELKGTNGNAPFEIIEKDIQNRITKKELKRYPSAVMIFTDGEAGKVNPQHPEKWIWILSNYSTRRSIPSQSIVHKLSDITGKKY